MSFIYNYNKNNTMKYWKNKFELKYFQIWKYNYWIFMFLKNIEIDTFHYFKNNDKNINHNRFNNEIKANDKDSIAIVVPYFLDNSKRRHQFVNLIQSLQNQTLKPKAIILVDDCSLLNLEISDIENLEHIHLPKNLGPANARNIGIQKAIEKYNAKIIAFTDSDCIVSNCWTENIFDRFYKHTNIAALSGYTYSLGNTFFDKYHNLNGTLNGRMFYEKNNLLYAPTCNLAVIAKCLKDIKFDIDFTFAAGEDIHLCYHFIKANYPIYFEEKMIVYHDFGYLPYRLFYNLNLFKKLFIKYALGEKILIENIPDYYLYLEDTIEISNVL